MNIPDTIKALELCIKCRTVPMLWGAPGIGKSDIVRQLGKQFDVPVIDRRLSQMDPVLLSGVPSVKDGKTIWNTPNFFPTVKKDGEEGILFLDEINQAAPSVSAAAYELILDRRLGDYKLPEGWHVIAAGNNVEDKAQINKMGSALANRFVHIDVEPDINSWSTWAYKNGIHPNVVTFLQWRPELLHNMDTTKTLKAFPTSRSWSTVNKFYAKAPNAMLHDMVASAVGRPAATEFIGYLNIFKELPTIKQMIADPDHVQINTKASIMFAMSSLITQSLAVENATELFIIINKLPIEFQVFIIKSFTKDNRSLVSKIPEITRWIIKNPEIFSEED